MADLDSVDPLTPVLPLTKGNPTRSRRHRRDGQGPPPTEERQVPHPDGPGDDAPLPHIDEYA